MRSRTHSAVSADAHQISFDQSVTRTYAHLFQMAVVCLETETVVYYDEIAVSAPLVITGILHDPVGGGPDRFASLGPQIYAGMKLPAPFDRVLPPPVCARDTAHREGNPAGHYREEKGELGSREGYVFQPRRSRKVFSRLFTHKDLEVAQAVAQPLQLLLTLFDPLVQNGDVTFQNPLPQLRLFVGIFEPNHIKVCRHSACKQDKKHSRQQPFEYLAKSELPEAFRVCYGDEKLMLHNASKKPRRHETTRTQDSFGRSLPL